MPFPDGCEKMPAACGHFLFWWPQPRALTSYPGHRALHHPGQTSRSSDRTAIPSDIRGHHSPSSGPTIFLIIPGHHFPRHPGRARARSGISTPRTERYRHRPVPVDPKCGIYQLRGIVSRSRISPLAIPGRRARWEIPESLDAAAINADLDGSSRSVLFRAIMMGYPGVWSRTAGFFESDF